MFPAFLRLPFNRFDDDLAVLDGSALGARRLLNLLRVIGRTRDEIRDADLRRDQVVGDDKRLLVAECARSEERRVGRV